MLMAVSIFFRGGYRPLTAVVIIVGVGVVITGVGPTLEIDVVGLAACGANEVYAVGNGRAGHYDGGFGGLNVVIVLFGHGGSAREV